MSQAFPQQSRRKPGITVQLQPITLLLQRIWFTCPHYLYYPIMSKSSSPSPIITDSYEHKLSTARSLQSTDLHQAILMYKKCLFLNETPEVLVQLAACYETIYDTSTALALYRRADQLAPNSTNKIKELVMIKGLNLILSGSSKPLLADTQYIEFEEIYQRFKQFLLNGVKSQEILRSLCFLEVDYRVFAKEQLQKSNGLHNVLLLGYINLSLGNKVEAYRLFWRGFEIDKEDTHVNDICNIIQPQIKSLYKQTQLCLIEGKLQKCSLNIKKGLEMDAYNTQFLILKAYIHRSKGQYEEALRDLEVANTYVKDDYDKENLHNQMSLVYNEMGRMFFDQENLEEAIDLFNKANKFKPNDWGTKVNRGDCYKSMGDYNKAILDYASAFELNPSPEITSRMGMVLNSRGITYFNSGDYDDALKDFTAAVKHFPNSKFYFNRGRAYLQLSKFAEAISDFQTVLELEPTHAEALSYIIQHRKK